MKSYAFFYLDRISHFILVECVWICVSIWSLRCHTPQVGLKYIYHAQMNIAWMVSLWHAVQIFMLHVTFNWKILIKIEVIIWKSYSHAMLPIHQINNICIVFIVCFILYKVSLWFALYIHDKIFFLSPKNHSIIHLINKIIILAIDKHSFS